MIIQEAPREELDYCHNKLNEGTGSFLEHFLQAALRADNDNYPLLQPIVRIMMEKYPLRHVVDQSYKSALKERPLGNRFIVRDSEIVKITNGEILPIDEPLFLLRARDNLAVTVLYDFRQLCKANHCTDYILRLTDQTIEDFENFRDNHPERMKQPGSTKGA